MADSTTQPTTATGTEGGEGAAGGEKSTQTSQTTQTTATTEIPDLSKIPADQLAKALENPELWNLPRIKELREQAAEAKKLKEAQDKADTDALEKNKQFEELAKKHGDENVILKQRLQEQQINSALQIKLSAAGVVDLDAAVKLIGRDKIAIDDNGVVSGADEAIEALKTDKAYLFKPGSSTTSVGSATNPANGDGQQNGAAKFKRSQITPDFYKAHAEEINKAAAAGLIEDDGPAQQ